MFYYLCVHSKYPHTINPSVLLIFHEDPDPYEIKKYIADELGDNAADTICDTYTYFIRCDDNLSNVISQMHSAIKSFRFDTAQQLLDLPSDKLYVIDNTTRTSSSLITGLDCRACGNHYPYAESSSPMSFTCTSCNSYKEMVMG